MADTTNENTSTLSPGSGVKPAEGETLLTLAQAFELVLLNKKIHKKEWGDKGFFGFLENGVLKLHKPDGTTHNWILSDSDIAGADYIIIE